ncbi:MAG TPA: DUF1223 domain-containing protein [Terriglobales bacterium]|nr:DUF1223 domain-containing protein [Terriglobales bacterium]
MRTLVLILVILFVVCLSAVAVDTPKNTTPVLIELFTSEGCSSCPPADALLRQLDTQPISGVQLIVLSEHVDYWNHIGWKDPYSSEFFSQRQNTYAQRMGNGSVYTPQMIVDGTNEFVGSDSKEAQKAIEKSRAEEKLPVSLSNISLTNGTLHGQVEIGTLPEVFHAHSADVYMAIALNHAESQVLRGENEGRRMQHVAVAKNITKIGTVSKVKGFAQDAGIKLEGNNDPANLRVVVFAQDPNSGKVLGATLQQIKP